MVSGLGARSAAPGGTRALRSLGGHSRPAALDVTAASRSRTASQEFACAAVFLSAPFVMDLPAVPGLFAELFNTIRQLPSAQWSTVQAGSPGTLFDQEFGIFSYAPVLLLGFIGLAGMAGERASRRVAIPLILAVLLLMLFPGTSIHGGRSRALPGRDLLLLPLLVSPIAWLYARLPDNSL